MNKATVEDVQKIRNTLAQQNPFSDWEDYYWCAKILCADEAADFDAALIIQTLKSAIKFGLSYRANKEAYLDAIKILATLNSQLGQHEIVLNYLSSVLELDENAPDWIYHDFVASQIHTDYMKRILRRPKMFLSDLERNDNGKETVIARQKSIFKEFLVEAAKYKNNHPDCEVDCAALTRAANAYGLADSEGWKLFLGVCNGTPMEAVIPTPEPEVKKVTSSRKEPVARPTETRPLIISLFPDDPAPAQEEVSELEKEHADLLAELDKARAALEQTRKELEDKEASLEALNQEREQLAATAKTGAADQQRLQSEINKFSSENEILRTKIKELEATQSAELKKVQNNSTADIISHVHIYLHTTQLALVKWLNHNLPSCSANWWDSCVIDALSYEQRERAHENRIATLEQFDLAALLRVMSKNWGNFRRFMFMSDADRDCLQKMFDVRNRWSHMDSTLPTKDEIKEDLYTIAEFMTQLHCSKESVKEVNEYARTVGRMSI